MARKKKSAKKVSMISNTMGRSKRSIKMDSKRKAKSPGFRKTKSKRGGYYESRPNRSDVLGYLT